MLLMIFPESESIEYILSNSIINSQTTFQNVIIYNLSYQSYNYIAAICGYGKVNVSRALTLATELYDIDSALAVSTAGSLNAYHPKIFSLIIPDAAFQYDVDFTSLGYPGATLPCMETGIFDTDSQINTIITEAATQLNVENYPGLIASSDKFTANDAIRMCLKKTFYANAVDTECGTLGQFSNIMQIPYSAIKVICNNAGCDAAEQYDSYHNEALLIAQKIALQYIQLLI